MTNLTTTTPTLEEALARFLRTLQGANKSAATITAYRTDLAQFIAFLHETNCTVSPPASPDRTWPNTSAPSRTGGRAGSRGAQAGRDPGVLPLPRRKRAPGAEPDRGDRDAQEGASRTDDVAARRGHQAVPSPAPASTSSSAR